MKIDHDRDFGIADQLAEIVIADLHRSVEQDGLTAVAALGSRVESADIDPVAGQAELTGYGNLSGCVLVRVILSMAYPAVLAGTWL